MVCGGLSAFHSTPMHDPGQNQESQRPVRVCVCKGASALTTLPPQLLLLASMTARRSATSSARCATAQRLSSGVSPGVAPWLPHEGPANGEGSVPPGAVLLQACPLGEQRWNVEA